MQRLSIKIYGKVHGIFFRVGAKEKADELGLVGWVKNESDGTVRLVAEGKTESLKKMKEWCKLGPKFAKIEKVEEEWIKIEELSFNNFKIVY